MNLWSVEHFIDIFFIKIGILLLSKHLRGSDSPLIKTLERENLILMKKMSMKCSTDQRFIRKRNTTYKIGTLALKITKIVRRCLNNKFVWNKDEKNLNNKHLSHICFKLRKSWNALLNKKFWCKNILYKCSKFLLLFSFVKLSLINMKCWIHSHNWRNCHENQENALWINWVNNTDYGHTMAKSLILYGPNANLNSK